MVEALTDVSQISKLAYGFMASKALFAALNLELFRHLSQGASTLAELSAATGVRPQSLATLLATLRSVGVVTATDGTYANAPAAERYLVPGRPAYFGDYYRHQIDRQLYPGMMGLDAGLRGDTAGLAHDSMSSMLADPVEAEAFSRAQHAGSIGPALMLSKALSLDGARSLLDVAGGTGAFSICFCRANPALRASIIDFPSVTAVAQRFVAEAGLADRIALVPGDAREVEWPVAQDVILMSYLLSAVGESDIDLLLARAHAALAPGGRLIIHDFMLDEDQGGPMPAAVFFLFYLALRTDPLSFTASEIKQRCAQAGFVDATDAVLIPEITKTVMARKRA
jgi:2-hydroxy-4-(methylsulfanyl)butanoate S-methyltransferase